MARMQRPLESFALAKPFVPLRLSQTFYIDKYPIPAKQTT
jgi:hypothetical protein